jgi:hypothetical protein
MQDIVKETIDGQAYEFYYLPPSKAIRILTRLAKLVLGPFGLAIGGGGTSLANLAGSEITLDKAFEKLSENLSEEEVERTIKELLSYVRLGTGMEMQIDIQFQGKIMHMLNVTRKALEVNYQDFFVGISAIVKKFAKPVAAASTTPEPSLFANQSGELSPQGSARSRK